MTSFILKNDRTSHFTFSEPPERGPIEVRQAQGWHHDEQDPETIYVSYWRTVRRFPKGQTREAIDLARTLYETNGDPTDVIMLGTRKTTLGLARFST